MIAHWEKAHDLSPQPVSSLRGRYMNRAIRGPNLWNLLTYTQSEENDSVRIDFVSSRKLMVTLERGGADINSRILKYKAHPYRVDLAHQHHLGGLLFPLFWTWPTEELSLGITPGNDLSVYRVWSTVAFLGLFPITAAGGGPGLVYTYKRVDELSSHQKPHCVVDLPRGDIR